MQQTLVIAVAAVVAIAVAATLGPRRRVPAPLLLLLLGVLVSALLPDIAADPIDPEVILIGVLPPLLFTASTSLPAMSLRREFGAVSALSVVLVVLTALALGAFFSLVVPGVGFAAGVALGAVISPTDAVATSIVRRAGVSSRVTAILEGESLLNDATALVLLRAAVGAIGATAVSVPAIAGEFARSLLVAIVVGVVVALLAQLVRRRVTDPAIGTLLSFTLPFLASLPAEALGGSGLIAAVAAGLVVGRRSPRISTPQQRLSDQQNWRTISTALEGAVFLLMGLQVRAIVEAVGDPALAWSALGFGAAAPGLALVVRAGFVAPLLAYLHLRSRRGEDMKARLAGLQEPQVGDDPMQQLGKRRSRPLRRTFDVERFRWRLRQALADIDYLLARPLGPREGAVVVWAGMRGAVTVAAAQTFLDSRAGGAAPLLVLIAFAAAALSLVLQGGTLAALIRVLRPRRDDPAALEQERQRIRDLMRRSVEAVPEKEGESRLDQRVRQLTAQRTALLDARDSGVFDAGLLAAALETVDSAQITTELFDDAPR